MDIRKELAPTGKLRVGLNYGNFLLVLKDAADGSPQGIAPDLGRELGKRLGVPVEFVRFPQAGELADAVKSGAWDVAFLGAEPKRAAEIAFTAAYLEIPITFLVPAGSPIHALAEVDRDGVRVAVADKSAYELYLTRTLKHAKLFRAQGSDASYALFVKERMDALAGLKPRLVQDAEKLAGSRVLDGQISGVQQALGVPRNRENAAKYTRDFVDEIKRSGLVAKTIDKHRVRGVTVAP